MEKDSCQTNAVMSPSDIISRTGLLYVIGRQHFPYDLLMLSQRNRLFLFNFSSLTANVADLLVLAGNLKVNVMDDGPAKLKFIPDHFQVPTSSIESPESRTSSITEPGTDQSPRSSCHQRTRRKLRRAFMLNLFTPRRLSWGSNTGGQEKVELTAAELESLRLELADIEEREAHLKAQLEHIDEVLRSARLSGYLYIRTVLIARPTPVYGSLV
ncbi:hypothetical protein HKD37_08G020822 [Glycine soja]